MLLWSKDDEILNIIEVKKWLTLKAMLKICHLCDTLQDVYSSFKKINTQIIQSGQGLSSPLSLPSPLRWHFCFF